LVGKLIGKKGENINDIRERHGVEVYIEDAPSSSSRGRQMSTVTVTGETAESVKAARDELEFITVKLPVEEDQVGWILGKGYQTITDIARKTELHHARYDDSSKSLELCGLRHQVEDAKLLISVHREYLPVYQDMDEEKELIQQSFDQLDERSGMQSKGKGKKGSKGEEDSYPSKGKDGKGKDGKDGKGKEKGWRDQEKGKEKGWRDEEKGKEKGWRDQEKGKEKGWRDEEKGKEKGWRDEDGEKGWRSKGTDEFGKNGKGKDGKNGYSHQEGKDGKGKGGKDGGKDGKGKDGKDKGKEGKDDKGRKGKDGKGYGKDNEGYGDDGKSNRKGKGGGKDW